MIAITFALPTESSALLRRLDQRQDQVADRLKIIPGRLGSLEVSILHTGVGQKHCAPRMEQFLTTIRPDLLLSSGFAGSLTDGLKASDLIIADNCSDPELVARLIEGGGPATRSTSAPSGSQELAPPSRIRFHHVRLATVDSISNTAQERTRLAQEMKADAIDMETATIAQICAAHGVPMLSLRVISDSPTAPFPAPPDVLFDVVRQKTDFGRLIPYVLAHPATAIRLFRFAQQISRARAALTSALIEVLTSIGDNARNDRQKLPSPLSSP